MVNWQSKLKSIFISFVIIASFLAPLPLLLSYSSIFNIFTVKLNWKFLENILLLIFLIEFIVNFFERKDKFKFLFSVNTFIDVLVLLSFYKKFLVFRFLSLFKIFRYSQLAKILLEVIYEKLPELLMFGGVVILVIVFLAITVFYVEHKAGNAQFKSLTDAFWWGIVTLTTVGYGDVYPMTPLGRLLAGFAMLLGIGIIAIPTSIVSTGLTEKIIELKKGRKKMNQLNNHVVILGVNSILDTILSEIKNYGVNDIVVVSKEKVELPDFVKYRNADYTKEQILQELNLEEAKAVLILSQFSNSENPDANTLLAAMLVKKIAPSVYTIVEILEKSNMSLAKDVIKCDEVISHNELLGSIMSSTLFTHKISEVIKELADFRGSRFFKEEAAKYITDELDFKDLLKEVMDRENSIVIGVERAGNVIVAPEPNFKVKVSDKILLIKGLK